MYQKILVPLDGSRRAEAILPYVIELAQGQESSLLLLNVVEPILTTVSPYPSPITFDVEALSEQKNRVEAYLADLASNLIDRGIPTDTLVEQGSIVATTASVAEREDVDLIAIASHGRTGLARAFYGSVAAGLLNRVDRPLLLIRSIDEQVDAAKS